MYKLDNLNITQKSLILVLKYINQPKNELKNNNQYLPDNLSPDPHSLKIHLCLPAFILPPMHNSKNIAYL